MPTVPEQLQQLADLLKEGLITREQFEEQRDQVLADDRARRAVGQSTPEMLTEVGAYHLLGVIGEGGMGVVYRGRHRSVTLAERQGGDVAVKVMHPQYARNPEYRARFEHEAALGLKLDHPGIVKVLDLVLDGGNLALVMDYVDGRALSASIGEAAGPIPWKRACSLLDRLLEAVSHAHSSGVVHRDLKPENILMTADGAPHVIDFGIAKDLGNSRTRTGTGMGTVEYMAPEQYTDAKAIDQRADLYSLGMILYEMLAGRLPWDADAPQFRILEQKANKEIKSPHAFRPGIPGPIVKALAPTLAADPDERPGSVDRFRRSLRAAVAEADASPPMEPEPNEPEPSAGVQADAPSPAMPESAAPAAVARVGDRVIVERHRKGRVIGEVHGNLKVEFDDGRVPRTKLVPPGRLERETSVPEAPPDGGTTTAASPGALSMRNLPAVAVRPPKASPGTATTGITGGSRAEAAAGRRLRVDGTRDARLLDIVHGNLKVEFVDGPAPRIQLIPATRRIEFLDGRAPRELRGILQPGDPDRSPLSKIVLRQVEDHELEDESPLEKNPWVTAVGCIVLTAGAAVFLLLVLTSSSC